MTGLNASIDTNCLVKINFNCYFNKFIYYLLKYILSKFIIIIIILMKEA